MKYAGYKPIDSYLAYYMEGSALSQEFSRDQVQIRERNLTTANPKSRPQSQVLREFLLQYQPSPGTKGFHNPSWDIRVCSCHAVLAPALMLVSACILAPARILLPAHMLALPHQLIQLMELLWGIAYNLIAEWARLYMGDGGKNNYSFGVSKELTRMANEEKARYVILRRVGEVAVANLYQRRINFHNWEYSIFAEYQIRSTLQLSYTDLRFSFE